MSVPLRVAAALVVALLSGAPLASGSVAGAARASVPAPTAATVHLSIGGDRATAQTVAPLAGVRFGLYTAQPTAVGPQGDTTQAAAYSCVSDAAGDCSVRVPIGDGGIAPGTRLWAAPVAVPVGWTTGPDTSTDFRTDPLYPGRTVTLPGLWPLTRATAPLAKGCAHSVGVVTGGAPGSAVADLAATLRGTPSRITWYGAGGATGLFPVASAADASSLTSLVEPGGSRSWRASLDTLAAADGPAGTDRHLDVAVVLGSVDLSGSAAANRLAALGTRVVTAADTMRLRGALRQGCGPSLTLVVPRPVTATPAGGAAAATDPVTGAVTLPGSRAVRLSVRPTAAGCTDLSTGSPVPSALNGTKLKLATPPSTPVSCAVSLPADGTGPITVRHQWEVTTAAGATTYADGQQPADLQATLSVAGHDQAWGSPRPGFEPGAHVAVSDTFASALPGCTSTGATVSDGAGTERPLGSALTPGAAWVVTDHVTCHSRLTLQAAVVGGAAQPGAWTLTASGSSAGPSGASGSAAASAEVPSGVGYRLGQSGGSPTYVATRTDCRITDGGHTAIGYDRPGSSITVPLGHDVTCTTTEATAELTLVTSVEQDSAAPTSWPLSATPADPHPAGLSPATVTGSGTVAVRPSLAYAVRQGAGPVGYQLTGLTCTVDGAHVVAGAVTIPPGSAGTCTATNAASSWTVTQSSDPASGWSLAPNSVVTYTVTASHLAGRPTTDVAIEDDLAAVLDQGQVIDDSVGATSGTAKLHGTRLTWTIPQLGGAQKATFRVRIAGHTDGSRLLGVISRASTTEAGGAGDAAVPCAQTSLSHTVAHDSDHSDATRCDAVVHPTLEAGAHDGRRLAWLIGGALAVSVVGTAAAAIISRRRSLRA